MQSEIRSSIAFLTDVNVTTCFQHRLFYITRRRSPVHSIQLINTHLRESLSAFFLIVHHKECFPSSQHKVVCKLLLTVVCGRPSLLSSLERWPVQFARPPHFPMIRKSLPSFVQHPCPYNWTRFKTHTSVYAAWWGSGGLGNAKHAKTDCCELSHKPIHETKITILIHCESPP